MSIPTGAHASTGRALAYWLAAAVAMSPAIAGSIELIVSSPWAHYVALTPLLLANCLRLDRTSTPTPSVGVGGGALALGLALQLVGISGDSQSIAQLGLPLTALGVSAVLGRPRLRPMLLCFWMVPAPYFLATLTTPWAESMLAAFSVEVGSLLGADVTANGPLIGSGDARLELTSSQGGMITALVLAELGCYSALRGVRPSGISIVLRSLSFGLTVVLVQPLAVLFAVFLLAGYGSDAAELWMSHGLWVLTAAVCVAYIEWREREKRTQAPFLGAHGP